MLEHIDEAVLCTLHTIKSHALHICQTNALSACANSINWQQSLVKKKLVSFQNEDIIDHFCGTNNYYVCCVSTLSHSHIHTHRVHRVDVFYTVSIAPSPTVVHFLPFRFRLWIRSVRFYSVVNVCMDVCMCVCVSLHRANNYPFESFLIVVRYHLFLF